MLKRSRLAFLLVAALLTGCPATDDYGKVVDQFQDSSSRLAFAFRALVEGANLVEEDAYLDAQVFEAQAIDLGILHTQDLLTPDEIELRVAAVHALADYTCALATLAEGKPSASFEADSGKAAVSLKSLTADATTALARPTAKSKTPDYAGPVSSAATAIGEFLAFVEKHRGEAQVKESLRKNDPAVTALFNLLAEESTSLYDRRKVTLATASSYAFRDYASARRRVPLDPAELLQLSDRIKHYQRETALLAESNPNLAIQAFQDSHAKLVAAVLAPKSQQKQSIAQLIVSIKAFAAQTAPLSPGIANAASTL